MRTKVQIISNLVEKKTLRILNSSLLTTYDSSGMNGHCGCLVRAHLEFPPEYRETDNHKVIYTFGSIYQVPVF